MVIGILLALLLLLATGPFLGPYSIGIVIIIMFAMNYSTYRTNKKIAGDLQMIKKKMGLMTEEEQIELDIKQGIQAEKNPIAMGKINAEIERELELELGHKEEENRR